MVQTDDTLRFIAGLHPYNTLPQDQLARVAGVFIRRQHAAGDEIYRTGAPLDGLYLIEDGVVEILDDQGELLSVLGRSNSFGERGLMRDGRAATTARMTQPGTLLLLPKDAFARLLRDSGAFARFFGRGRGDQTGPIVASVRVAELLGRDPVAVAPHIPIGDAARLMRDRRISSLGVVQDGRLIGLVTVRDMANRVVAEGRNAADPVATVMTPDPVTLGPEALGADVLALMLDRRIGHLPVVADGRFAGMVTQTDLIRVAATSSSILVREALAAPDVAALAAITARIPQLLATLMAHNQRHEAVTRQITDISDAVTRRLIALAESELGPAPAPWCWAACGSQGRQEQTGVTDQDNVLILADEATGDEPWFTELARRVSHGLNRCGYVYCPGDMMATAARWRKPLSVWRQYFRGWIANPQPQAQMLASVMFDLRAIAGDGAMLERLRSETLEAAARDQIFVGHMIANSLKHRPPLGLIGGLATIRSGEHRSRLDLKLGGVVPVVDLARVYALQGRLPAVNTRERLAAAQASGIISTAGGDDLLAAYDLIATERLDHQAQQVRRGERPDNFVAPADLPDLRRSHLRDAFVVVRTMQSALSARGTRA